MQFRTPRLLQPLITSSQFRYLFGGLVVSRVGDAFTVVALSWLMLTIAGPAELGILLFLTGLPSLVGAPLAGVLVDRVGLRAPIALDNLFRGIVMASLAAVTISGSVQVWHLYVGSVALAAVGSVSDVGFEVAVPAVVADIYLEEANTLTSVVWDVAALIGPVAAGTLIAWQGPGVALAVDSATFFVTAALALPLPKASVVEKPNKPPDRSSASSGLRQLAHGFRSLGQNRPVLVFTVVTIGILALSGAQEVVYPVFVSSVLELDADAYGLLMSAAGACSLCGTVFLTPLFRRWRPVWALSIAVGLRGVLLAPMFSSRTLLSGASWAATSTALDGPYFPLSRALSQRLVPAHERGAVTGARASLSVIGFPLGSALGGLAVAWLSAPAVLLAIAASHIPLVIVLIASRGVRRLPAPQ